MARSARAVIVVLALAAAAWSQTPALAHVDVLPVRAPDGQATEFTIRVPAERAVPTMAVSVRFPSGIMVFSVREPPPGWTARLRRSPDGRLTGVVFDGGRIGANRYESFQVLGTPLGTGTTVWESEQTYADGVVVAWTAEPDPTGTQSDEAEIGEPGPAAAVEIVPPSELVVAASSDDGGSGPAIWLGVIAIGLAALAALATGLLWSSRPRDLPPDPDAST